MPRTKKYRPVAYRPKPLISTVPREASRATDFDRPQRKPGETRADFLEELHDALARFNMRTTGSAAVDAVRKACGPWQ